MYLRLAAAIACAAAVPAAAQITTFNDRASFDAAAGSTTTETFESCGAGGSVSTSLSASNPGPCGAIAPGVSFAPDAGFDLYIAGPGQSANPTTALGVNFPQSGNNQIGFAGGSFVFAGDFNQNFGGGTQRGTPVDFIIELFDLGGGLLGSYRFAVASGAPTFHGLTSTALFGSLKVRSDEDGYAVVDNVSFASQGVVPEPGTWALLIAGFAAVGVAARRRKAILAV